MINNISSKSKNNLVLDFTYTEKQEYLLKSPPPTPPFFVVVKTLSFPSPAFFSFVLKFSNA